MTREERVEKFLAELRGLLLDESYQHTITESLGAKETYDDLGVGRTKYTGDITYTIELVKTEASG